MFLFCEEIARCECETPFVLLSNAITSLQHVRITQLTCSLVNVFFDLMGFICRCKFDVHSFLCTREKNGHGKG